MATKAKDSTTSGKELKRSHISFKLPHKPHQKTSTTKQVPNYLRPTLSAARHENSSKSSLAGSKKHGSEETASSQKPTLSRRRSFDKPPSPSRLRKSLISPGRDTSLRSSSFTAKSSNVSKPSIDRSNSKMARAGKPQLLYAKSVKKSSTSGSAKKESTASTRPPKSEDITQTLDLEADLEAIESLDHQEVEEVGMIESEEHEKVVLPDPKVEEKEQVDDHGVSVEAEANGGEDEKLKPSDSSTVNAEELQETVEERNEESGNALVQEEKPADNEQHQGEDNQNKLDESSEAQPEEGLASEETKVEVKEDKGKAISDKEDGVAVEESKNVEDMALDEKEGIALKEGEKADGGIEEAKAAEAAEAAEETVKPSQTSEGSQGGKKDSAPAYNDVIEETASKLLEKRKNKVKALVGAFETVIDYESGSK
ncbi:micronuclear linker histone polyprotein [Prunus yedoensis var. nudiflora]|uniref:Micronuclear linker histone polyprotein n=1 Tax=Prunus yedoensis var. nudiflora TaxID=2094558 RepID=A0A314UN42_PRUYE|nr:micronuclear linker histone polyprotein [Prunus yedoensis var. nudiflora]